MQVSSYLPSFHLYPYLPIDNHQDEETVESVVYFEETGKLLEGLLEKPFPIFLKELCSNTSLQVFLETFLTNHTRPYDEGCQTQYKTQKMLWAVFMIFMRLFSNERHQWSDVLVEPSKNTVQEKSEEMYGKLLQEYQIINLYHIFDFCALYSNGNSKQMMEFTSALLECCPTLIPEFHQLSQPLTQIVLGLHDRIQNEKHLNSQDASTIMGVLRDLVSSLNALFSVFDQLTLVVLQNDSNGPILEKNSLLYSLLRSYECDLGKLQLCCMKSPENNDLISFIRAGILNIMNKWISFQHFDFEKMYCLVLELVDLFPDETDKTIEIGSFLSDYARLFHLQRTLRNYEQADPSRVSYINQMISNLGIRENPLSIHSTASVSITQNPMPNSINENLVSTREELISLISQVKDLLPYLGDGFIELCLNAYNNDVEQVIHAVLEDNLREDLRSLDQQMTLEAKILLDSKESLETVPPPRPLSSKRMNIYDGDEMDTAEFLDPSKIWVGKKKEGAVYRLDSLQEDRKLTEHYKIELEKFDYDEYNDEYNDEFDEFCPVGVDDNLTTDFEEIKALNARLREKEEEDQFWESMRNKNRDNPLVESGTDLNEESDLQPPPKSQSSKTTSLSNPSMSSNKSSNKSTATTTTTTTTTTTRKKPSTSSSSSSSSSSKKHPGIASQVGGQNQSALEVAQESHVDSSKVARSRNYKEKNKAKAGNHDRKNKATKKFSRGMA